MPNVVIVSNRLPVSVKKIEGELEFSQSIGGLATGLSSYATQRNNKWIGWPGIVSEELTEDDKQLITKRLRKNHCYPVFLSQKQVDEFYNGFSNSILWPAFHNLPVDTSNQESFWATYRKVNQLFTDAIVTLSPPKTMVWVHDYQLLLVPQMLREQRPHETIGFFLHTPFPDAINYQGIAHNKSLLKGLLGADLLGFHTPSYVNNFLETAQELKVGTVLADQIILPDRTIQVTDFPISIDYIKYAEAGRQRAVKNEVKRLHKQYGRYKTILAFDRLDLTKGFIERLEAYRQFLEENPRQHNKVKMIMVAAPSRTDLPAYQELRERVEVLVDEINMQFGTKRWLPVDYLFKALPFEQVTALYQVADICFITPLRDGMNLMAKEYIAANRGKKGILILSETAGAAEELTNALLVNPAQPKTLVAALSKAVNMDARELKKRLNTMQDYLSTHTIQDWSGSFMTSLQRPGNGVSARVRHLKGDVRKTFLKTFRASSKRLILLDYDGVLAEFRSNPQKASPTPLLMRRLNKLIADPKNEIVLVSGRSRQDLEQWFGGLPISLAAEHGAIIKMRGKSWQKHISGPSAWKRIIQPILEKYAAKVPGAFVEAKETALVWHYRTASPYHAQKNIVILKRILRPVLKSYGLGLYSGNGILEVKMVDTHKGSALDRWLKQKPDFIMAIGDDYTDEDMFRALPPEAHTIKVGPGRTAARFRLPSVMETIKLLDRMT